MSEEDLPHLYELMVDGEKKKMVESKYYIRAAKTLDKMYPVLLATVAQHSHHNPTYSCHCEHIKAAKELLDARFPPE